ncbi:trans-3-hydroxy-L-proline dehydratase [Truepera radiovictrix]|uniref:Proline racemase n=1 Tax=Truepera radiovictrix (strain DSM 17093 / CIP 108686 / LMG 22925 / RQ-24) TaxID=649638 RepID=D7CU77_TRURR|nr:trans-3-hydroxy-L-proline dehydratase [Truepera radiovictrix]ADI13975.1 proline racemase [Truepera radiovictrix DSM 17093]WMT57463.1 proline racemase family protein [Truepera radiovictrix]
MEFRRTYTTIDAHTAGEPLRIVTAGIPLIPGATMLEKRRWVRDNLDGVRRSLMWEPRGHADMYGCYVTPPVTPEADFGVIFMHNEGYSTMCGHGIIAVATVAVATGMVSAQTPETRVGIDSPAGFIEAFVAWDGRKASGVRFRNVPSFLYARDLTVVTPSFGELTLDIAFGGAFYAYLDGAQAGLAVRPENTRALVQLGDEVKRAVEATLEVVHPEEPALRGLYGTIIGGPPRHEGSDQANICVFADREVDRSPTGTGTAGRMAQLYARGRLALGQTFVNESILGTVFTGRVLSETTVGDLPAVVPEVSGSAHITGFCQWVVEPDDAVGEGFLLR